MAARWSDSPQDNEESKHRAITPSSEVGLWMEMSLDPRLLIFTVQFVSSYCSSLVCDLWWSGREQSLIVCIFARSLIKHLFFDTMEWKKLACGVISYSLYMDPWKPSVYFSAATSSALFKRYSHVQRTCDRLRSVLCSQSECELSVSQHITSARVRGD